MIWFGSMVKDRQKIELSMTLTCGTIKFLRILFERDGLMCVLSRNIVDAATFCKFFFSSKMLNCDFERMSDVESSPKVETEQIDVEMKDTETPEGVKSDTTSDSLSSSEEEINDAVVEDEPETEESKAAEEDTSAEEVAEEKAEEPEKCDHICLHKIMNNMKSEEFWTRIAKEDAPKVAKYMKHRVQHSFDTTHSAIVHVTFVVLVLLMLYSLLFSPSPAPVEQN